MTFYCPPSSSYAQCSWDMKLLILFLFGLVFAAIVCGNFFRLVWIERQNGLHYPRIQILNLRMAEMLLLFSVVSLFMYLFPNTFPIFEAVEAFIEGYCVCCFFKMITIYVGSSKEIQYHIRTFLTSRWLKPRNPEIFGPYFFAFLKITVYQFFFLRPLIVLAAGIVELKQGKSSLYAILTAFYIISLVVTIVALIRTYQIFGVVTAELAPLKKITFVKGYIVFIVIQNVIVNMLSTTSKISFYWNQRRRLLAFIVLGELMIVSFLMSKVFISRPWQNVNQNRSLGPREKVLLKAIQNESLWWFAWRVFKIDNFAFQHEDLEGYAWQASSPTVPANSLLVSPSSRDYELTAVNDKELSAASGMGGGGGGGASASGQLRRSHPEADLEIGTRDLPALPHAIPNGSRRVAPYVPPPP